MKQVASPSGQRQNAWGAPAEAEQPPSVPSFAEEAQRVLLCYVSAPQSWALIADCERAAGLAAGKLTPALLPRLVEHVERALGALGVPAADRMACAWRLRALEPRAALSSPQAALSFAIKDEADIVEARTACRQMCARLGFSTTGQTKAATAVSELARNIFQYAGRGRILLCCLGGEPPVLEIVAADQGPGIADVAAVLGGGYRSRTGLGQGLRGVRRLMDTFEIASAHGQGTTVTVRKARE